MTKATSKEQRHINVIQEVLRDGLIFSELRNKLQQKILKKEHKGLWGYCQCASEALLILLDSDNYELMFCKKVPGAIGNYSGHYWVRRKSDGYILDPTKDQFEHEPEDVYDKGKKHEPKKRPDQATKCLVCHVQTRLSEKC